MLSRLLTAFATVSLTFTALAGCDADDAAAVTAITSRAVTITDAWGTHDPAHFPEVSDCQAYWDERCAELSPQSCGILKARYTCQQADQGVVITDHFADAETVPAEKTWRVFTPGMSAFSDLAAAPADACAQLDDGLVDACLELAAVAEIAPGVEALAPEGGVAPVVPVAQIKKTSLLLKGDLMLAAIGPLDWSVPALPFGARVALGEAAIVEDNVMYLAGPEGTVIVSSKDIVLIRDVRCTMDKVEVCVDVDVK